MKLKGDTEIVCKNGEAIFVHLCLWRVQCPQILEYLKENDNKLDISVEALRVIESFVYGTTLKLEQESLELLLEVYFYASRFSIKFLEWKALKAIGSLVQQNNNSLLKALHWGNENNKEDIKQICLHYASNKTFEDEELDRYSQQIEILISKVFYFKSCY